MARFVVDVVPYNWTSALTRRYMGPAKHHPAVNHILLIYGYATGGLNDMSDVTYIGGVPLPGRQYPSRP